MRIIDPVDLMCPPTTKDFIFSIKLKEIARRIQQKNPCEYFVGKESKLSTKLSNILWFEPYRMIKLILIKELFDETKSEAQLSDNNQKQLATCFEGKEKELERILLDKEYGDELEEMNITDRSSTSKEKCRVIFNTWSKLSHHNTCGALRETFDRYSIFSGENPLEMVR